MEEENQPPDDDTGSPIGRIHPDCETSKESARKAVDVWNSLQSSPKVSETTRPQTSVLDLMREREFNSPTPSEESSSVEGNPGRQVSAPGPRESMGLVAPESEWSSAHGSEQTRVIVRTSGSESHANTKPISPRSTPQTQIDSNYQNSGTRPSTGKQRTPLPFLREQSQSQNAATISLPIVIQSPEISQYSPPISSAQTHDPTERSWRNETAQTDVSNSTNNTQEQLAGWSISGDRHELQSENQRPKWGHDDRAPGPPSPSLDRLQNLGSSSTAKKAYSAKGNVPSSVLTREQGPFTIFPSSFSVLTTESVQQKSQAKSVKRRGRKSADHNVEGSRTDPPAIVPHPEVEKPASFALEDGLPKQAPILTSHSQQANPPAQRVLPAIPVSHGFYQMKLPPRPTTTPPPAQSTHPSEPYRPPAVVFTVDNGAKSELLTADVQSFVDKFKHNARVIITGFKNPNSVHEIDVIMFQSLPFFYKWYSENSGITDIGPLRFELIDVHWQQEKSFVVPDGNLDHFRTLKQYIWDLYWVAMDMNKSLGMFRVAISQFPLREETPFGEGAAASGWKAVNSSIPPKFVLTPNSQSIMVVPTGVPKDFRTQAQTSPPNQPLSILPPPIRSMHHSSGSHSMNDPKDSPRNSLQASLPSPNQSPYLHGPYSRDSFQQPPHNENESRNTGQTQHHSQSLHGPVNVRRTAWDQTLLRDYARSLLRDAELMGDESTVKDKLPYKTGAEVCAVVVDKMSGKGLVTVSGRGYITLNITTGPEETGERFKEVTIQPKQTCMLHGGAVVLYFKRELGLLPLPPSRPPIGRSEGDERYRGDRRPLGSVYDQGVNLALTQERHRDEHPLPPPLTLPSKHAAPPQILLREDSQPTPTTSPLDIKIRVQVDGTGRFSIPFDKSVLRPKVTTTEFFAWFASQSRHSPPQPPHHLKFTFKDAMPIPQATEITAGNEDHFNYMRRDIKAQCEKARRFMPELREFVILVTVPGWVLPMTEEEEDEW
ncbi:hypothetical protein BKA65DRAFT_101929 [Rhexocercosporidium sp. MPI-PUGE-AT-0058]|nr:hypothetical protein BKA65DRAFT_101929 [Rhexocercosporidium sp. MPI-PUGE-AT-0058]